MSIPSDSNTSLYCPAQSFGTRMVMIPSVHLTETVFPMNCPQPGMNYQLNATSPFRIIRYNTPAQYQQIMTAHAINLHGNENNTNVKSMKKSLPTDDSTGGSKSSDARNEDPIDLSSTNLNNFSSSSKTSISPKKNETNKSVTPKQFILKSPKKEPISPPTSQGIEKINQPTEPEQQPEKEVDPDINRVQQQRKRKPSLPDNESQSQTHTHERELEGWVGHVKPVPGIPRQAGSKREEVLKAARSLFSKRTRTLYHWLYPSTSKNKLKATVAAAWDTLSTAEKDFYISQVLGRFGVPAGSLMVNPQLGGFKGLTGLPNTAAGSSSSSGSSDETGHAVSNLLLSEDDVTWASYPQAQAQDGIARKRKRQKANNGEGSSIQQPDDEETLILRKIHEEGLDEDFVDDPELSQEFEQFRMYLSEGLSSSDLDLSLDEIINGL